MGTRESSKRTEQRYGPWPRQKQVAGRPRGSRRKRSNAFAKGLTLPCSVAAAWTHESAWHGPSVRLLLQSYDGGGNGDYCLDNHGNWRFTLSPLYPYVPCTVVIYTFICLFVYLGKREKEHICVSILWKFFYASNSWEEAERGCQTQAGSPMWLARPRLLEVLAWCLPRNVVEGSWRRDYDSTSVFTTGQSVCPYSSLLRW